LRPRWASEAQEGEALRIVGHGAQLLESLAGLGVVFTRGGIALEA
jgi:hypothetical protein